MSIFFVSLVGAIAVGLLLAGAVAAGLICAVRTGRAVRDGFAALETVAGLSMEELCSLSVEQLTALDKRLGGVSAAGVIATAYTTALASHRIAKALETKTPEA